MTWSGAFKIGKEPEGLKVAVNQPAKENSAEEIVSAMKSLSGMDISQILEAIKAQAKVEPKEVKEKKEEKKEEASTFEKVEPNKDSSLD